ncbi:hypothetical protein Ahy_A10g048476 isoform B [Arachis hypogaea]|uniref:Uncharacterized protein n=1 Tax=Arachis hypogaea TaxID=3818 RepID=A0A445B573_ARAHY|nr:hypothetical protein Ahy_A10g048476 isoform B [Arachis hypogaea]
MFEFYHKFDTVMNNSISHEKNEQIIERIFKYNDNILRMTYHAYMSIVSLIVKKRISTNILQTISREKLIEDCTSRCVVTPYKISIGRPKIKRTRSEAEHPPGPNLSSVGLQQKCSNCSKFSHNKRGCLTDFQV